MSAPATPSDTQGEALRKQGLFLRDGKWITRKEVMVRARYGSSPGATRRAIDALKAGWHRADHEE